MNSSPGRDLMVGAFVLAALVSLAYLSVTLGGLSYTGKGGLKLFATFDDIGGLRPRAPVKIAGVRVGEVSAIVLDSDYRAKASLDLEGSLELPSDTSASILTLGVLGDQYIALEPGGEEILLRPGDEIAFTQSAIILERLIGKLVQNIGGS